MTGAAAPIRRAVVLFTRDLRLHDNPVLDTARHWAAEVIPVFVFDPALPSAAPNRISFLLDCLTDLRAGLLQRGGDLLIRHGDPVAEVTGLARSHQAQGIILAADVSRYAQRRYRRLAAACQQHRLALREAETLTVVPPGAVVPSGGDHYQLCWRDFYMQVTASFPDIATRDYRPRPGHWRDDPQSYQAWCAGQTGIPIIDAGMRQLAAEGFMPNRARMLAAYALTKQLRIHWTAGTRHFFALLVDGDIASNAGNWQWTAGTGHDTRPGRRFNLLRQARRFDPAGDYVRRYVPELATVPGPQVHQPWQLTGVRYPPPMATLTGHAESAAESIALDY